jgi:hypothetical protein
MDAFGEVLLNAGAISDSSPRYVSLRMTAGDEQLDFRPVSAYNGLVGSFAVPGVVTDRATDPTTVFFIGDAGAPGFATLTVSEYDSFVAAFSVPPEHQWQHLDLFLLRNPSFSTFFEIIERQEFQ